MTELRDYEACKWCGGLMLSDGDQDRCSNCGRGALIGGDKVADELKGQINIVVEAREKAEKAIEVRNQAKFKWEEENKAILDEAVDAVQKVEEAETILRHLTVASYLETGNKNPAPGIGIREMTTLEYEEKVAFDWALEHKMALKLDTSAFEKIAKASPLDFVKVFTEPKATIATALKKVEEVEA